MLPEALSYMAKKRYRVHYGHAGMPHRKSSLLEIEFSLTVSWLKQCCELAGVLPGFLKGVSKNSIELPEQGSGGAAPAAERL